MSIQHWPSRFRYHYKKYLAVFFVSLAIAFISADIILTFVNLVVGGYQPGLSVVSPVITFVILMVAYIMIFKGNLEGTGLAFQGVLSFVFLLLFNEIISLIFNSILTNINAIVCFRAGDYLSGALAIASYIFLGFQVLAGIFSYVRLRQYMTGQYVSSTGVKVWFMIYFGLFILSQGTTLALFFLSSSPENYIALFLVLLEPLSELCCVISSIFTVLRLSD